MATAEELRRAREETAFGGLASGLFEYMRERDQMLQEQGRRPVLGGLLSKEPVMGTDTLRYEGVMPLIAGLLEPIVRGVDAPRAASQGLIPQEDMVGEAYGTAGTAMLGGGAVAKPAGSLGANMLRSGKMTDPTETGWTFRDVKAPNLSREDNRRVSEALSVPRGYEVELPIRRLFATQDKVNPDFATTTSSEGRIPTVIRKDGEFFVRDGHHRLTKQAEAGNQNAKVWLYDLDNQNRDTPLLDYEPPRKLSQAEMDKVESYLAELGLLDETVSANASKSAGLLTTSAAELRRQANIQRFGYDPNETPEVDTSYRGSHQPVGPQDENPIRLDDVTKSITGEDAGYPDDFYSSQGMRLYAQPPSFPGDEYGIANQQSYRAIQAARGNPDAEVTIYRGVPDSDDITTINPGDFVTLSPKYAELHAASGYGPRGEDAGKVISQRVKVRDVYFAGDDVNEFGYFPTDMAANASKPIGILVLEQQARGNKQLGGLLESQGMDINDLSTADPLEIQGVLDMAARRGILNPRSAAGLKRGLLD